MEIVIRSIRDYSRLFELCKQETIDDNIIHIILNLNFINPHDVLLLVQESIFIRRKFPNIETISFNGRDITKRYLLDIGLITFLKSNFFQPGTIKFIDKRTAMPIRRVEKVSIEEYVQETLRYIGRICKGKELTILSIGIKESINNVYDHSESEIGAYVFCQYYPNVNNIKVCVTDIGIGIPESVRRMHPLFTDRDCIEWALKDKNTVASIPSNAGMGLATIRSFTKKTKGRLLILSGEYQYEMMSNGHESYTFNPIKNFKGTLIEITINVSELEDEEFVDDIF